MRKLVLAAVSTVTLTALGTAAGCGSRDDPEPSAPASASSRLSELLTPDDVGAYPMALAPRPFSFPEDHGPHPGYRNEWWYVTGNLDSAAGKRFGFELTLFRFALTSPERDATNAGGSAWSTNQVYIGHFAITDVGEKRFHVAQRYSRAALGLAGAESKPVRVWVEDWSLQQAPGEGGTWNLIARDRDLALRLSLQALKSPVLNGVEGLSRKSSAKGNASYYYSITRLRAQGDLSIGEERHTVAGLAWLDREWGSSALSREQQGWDWFALQLSDGSDLMYYNLRKNDGSNDPHSAGTWTPVEGKSVHLARDDVAIEVQRFWNSPQGGRYPMTWEMRIPRLDLELRVDPVFEAQELDTSVRYWEGAVDVTGARAGRAVDGRGYVELTGYARD